jgi:hypothetical protein
MTDLEATQRYGFNPRDRAACPWLWHITDDGMLALVSSASAEYLEPNYAGSSGPMTGGEAFATHLWRPL